MATIITKNSQTASAVPSAASLSVGELAVNTADGKLYTEHTGGVVKEIIPSTVVDGGITEAKIASNAVTTAKIANANVTVDKLSASGTPSSSTFLRGDGSWSAPTSGGVTSLNGQTGAVVTTDYNGIGSTSFAAYTGTSALTPGSTVSGSSLYRPTSVYLASGSTSLTSAMSEGASSSSYPHTQWAISTVNRRNTGNSGYVVPQGSTTLSGTWRVMYFCLPRQFSFDPCQDISTSSTGVYLFTRVS